MSSLVKSNYDWVHQLINERLKTTDPAKIVIWTAGTTLALTYLYAQLSDKVPWHQRVKKSVFKLVRKIPYVRNQIEEETEKVRLNFEKELLSHTSHMYDVNRLPEKGWTKEEILEQTKVYLGLGEFDWRKGTQSGTVYNGNEALTELMTEVYGMAAWTNPLHPDAFPGVRKMEAEIVRICCNLFNGGQNSCGTVTSGGTESIILACKAYRDYAKEVRGISNPVMVVPVTAHAAFDKAAALMDMGIIHVPVDPNTHKVDVKAMRRSISRSTCMLVGSAPQYPHGAIDDIMEIAKLGQKFGIPVHVDACLGGFLIAFMKDAGYPLKPFDFSVPGVTSISADTHKYGFAPKGSSVVLYSEPTYRHYQWFCTPDWPGGIYATSTISGSRAGGIVAACWASLVYFGHSGYVESTKSIIETTRYIIAELKNIDGIYVMGNPEVSVVALNSTSFNIYGLSDGLKKLGWNLNLLQFPSCIHICITMLQTKPGVADRFIEDVKTVTAKCLADPKACDKGSAAVYGMAQSIPDRSIVNEITWTYLDSLYVTGNKDKSAQANGGITSH